MHAVSHYIIVYDTFLCLRSYGSGPSLPNGLAACTHVPNAPAVQTSATLNSCVGLRYSFKHDSPVKSVAVHQQRGTTATLGAGGGLRAISPQI